MTWTLEQAKRRCAGCEKLRMGLEFDLRYATCTGERTRPFILRYPTCMGERTRPFITMIGPNDCPLGRVAMPDPDTVDLERERVSALFSADRSIETMFPGIAAETDRVLGKAKEEEVENG